MSSKWGFFGVSVLRRYPDDRKPTGGWEGSFEVAHVDDEVIIQFFCFLERLYEAGSTAAFKTEFSQV